MKTFLTITVFTLALALSPAPVAAQTPRADSAAVGVDFGVFLPKDDRHDKSLALDGFYEYYPSARTSIRLGVGWTHPKFSFDGEDGYYAVGSHPWAQRADL